MKAIKRISMDLQEQNPLLSGFLRVSMICIKFKAVLAYDDVIEQVSRGTKGVSFNRKYSFLMGDLENSSDFFINQDSGPIEATLVHGVAINLNTEYTTVVVQLGLQHSSPEGRIVPVRTFNLPPNALFPLSTDDYGAIITFTLPNGESNLYAICKEERLASSTDSIYNSMIEFSKHLNSPRKRDVKYLH